ncbi:MAG: mechanosensitive ion channel family protein [Patescibacteria group bacterium]
MYEITILGKTINAEILADSVTASFVIVAIALVAKLASNQLVVYVLKTLEDNDTNTVNNLEQRAYTLASIVKSFFSVAIFGIAFVMLLSEWGINIAPILTGAGIVGLAVGFGAQTLVKDIVTGFFILLENQFNVGQRVSIAGKEGIVKEMKLRATVIRDEENKTTYFVPNSQISTVTRYDKTND